MDFLQIDPRMDEHPDIEAAGFDGARVFEAVLRACARNDGRGRLRGKFAHPGWLARRMNLTCEVIGGMDPDTWVNHGLQRCTVVGLLERDGEDILIPGWEKFYAPKKTGAERTAEWERRKKQQLTPTDEADEERQPASVASVTDATQHHSTPLHITKDPQQQPAAVSEKPAQPPPSELAPDLEALEAVRAKRFGTNPIPIAIPGFDTLWPAVLLKHGGSKEYAFQTFANWLEDKWAKTLKPPGAINAFLAPEQWPKHVRPRAQSPPETELEPGPWGDVLRLLVREGKSYAVTMLKQARLVELSGSTLRLAAPDRYFAEWAMEQYGELLRGVLAQVLGHEGAVEFVEQSEQARGA